MRRVQFVCLTLLLSGCEWIDPGITGGDTRIVAPERDTVALFQTDSLSYSLREDGSGYTLSFHVRFTNTTQLPTYFVNCGGATAFHLEKKLPGRWVAAFQPAVYMCLSPPITLLPLEQHEMSMWVTGAHPDNNTYPKYMVDDVQGIYRVVWTNALSTYNERGNPFGDPSALRAAHLEPIRAQPAALTRSHRTTASPHTVHGSSTRAGA